MSYFTGAFDREWFTLEQAIAEIKELYDEEITIQDLLHFARNRRIDLKLKVESLSGNRLLAFGESKNISSKLNITVEDLDCFLKHGTRTKFERFKFGDLEYSFTEDSEYIEGFNIFYTKTFSFSGLLDIDNNLIDEFSDVITIPALSFLTNYNRKHLFNIKALNDLIVPISKVVILRDDLELFMCLTLESDDEPEESELESDTEKDEIIESQRAENETLRARIAELENQLKEQSAVNSEQVLESPKATRTTLCGWLLSKVGSFPPCYVLPPDRGKSSGRFYKFNFGIYANVSIHLCAYAHTYPMFKNPCSCR